MTIIKQIHGYKVEFNGSQTYFLSDSTGSCYGSYPTERKAINALNRTLKAAGLK
ncbi:MAG: hypothetical protein KAS78_02575 [Candidatus Pacebacteria bacterium]|nr:hypothetical protein [Candidatus Paceibacterota bacterium]